LHAVEHVCFLGSALLFWSAVIPTQRHRRAHGPRIAIVFANLLQSGALGALLLFATVVLYPLHRAGADLWGVRPLADQQLAGVIMWVPAGGIYFVTMAVLFARWLRVFEMRTGDAGAHRHA
jgi:putative membrane protein